MRGIDPWHKLIDREREDNVIDVKCCGTTEPSSTALIHGDAVTPGSMRFAMAEPPNTRSESGTDSMSPSTWMETAAGLWHAAAPGRKAISPGAAAVRRTVESAPTFGITTLTLYAFSSDNWRRPQREVDNLMCLLQKYVDSECAHLTDSGVRFTVIGRRDRISGSLEPQHRARRGVHKEGTALHLRVAIRLFSPRGLVGGGQPCRQRDAPDARGVRASIVRSHPRTERHP